MTIRREDLRNAHEEADVIIIHQMMSIVESSTNDINISVISDDTDVFVLLVHFYHDKELTCHVTMEATSEERKSIDIQSTARLHNDIAGQLPAAHAFVGVRHSGSVVGNWENKSRESAYVRSSVVGTWEQQCSIS